MSNIHYFQRYHAKENVVTNNTQLLFSRLYNHSPRRFFEFLQRCFADAPNSPQVGVKFTQQLKGAGGSIPDATISQEGFRIIIETKLHNQFGKGQIEAHLQAFEGDEKKYFLLLDPEPVKLAFMKSLHEEMKDTGAWFASLTFQDIITNCRSVLSDRDLEMQDIITDYEEFCSGEGLLPYHQYIMRARTSNYTYDQNMNFNIYYDQKDRGYRKHSYFGLYQHKSIQAIGKLKNVVQADYVDGVLTIHRQEKEISEEEKSNIINIMEAANIDNGWDITRNHNFFIVEKFFETDFKKITPYPMRFAGYFDLCEILDTNTLPEAHEIAAALNTKTWE